jgi:hypothetical protein
VKLTLTEDILKVQPTRDWLYLKSYSNIMKGGKVGDYTKTVRIAISQVEYQR